MPNYLPIGLSLALSAASLSAIAFAAASLSAAAFSAAAFSAAALSAASLYRTALTAAIFAFLAAASFSAASSSAAISAAVTFAINSPCFSFICSLGFSFLSVFVASPALFIKKEKTAVYRTYLCWKGNLSWRASQGLLQLHQHFC